MSNCVLHTPFGNAKIDVEGYYRITSGKEGNYNKRLHRLIYEKFWNVKLPKDIVIHHKDGNKTNNCILNLEALYNSEHSTLHRIMNNPNKSGDSFRGKHHSAESKRKISLANKGLKYDLLSRINNSKSRNTSGFFRVTTQPCKTCKQGFSYAYKYYDDEGKRKSIVSTNIETLEEKVKNEGLVWIKFDSSGNLVK